MYTKRISYEDWNGETREEDFRFNLSKSDIVEMEANTEGGLENYIKEISEKLDAKKIMEFTKMFILKSYGEKSLDGKRFMRSEEISRAFSETPAYDKLFMELVTDADALADFIANVIPKDVRDQASKFMENQNGPKLVTQNTENNSASNS